MYRYIQEFLVFKMTSEETEPALHEQKVQDEQPKDQIVAVIGETGRWQLQKILIVFFVSIPGLAHIFVSAFVAPKQDFWCADDLDDNDVLENGVPENILVYSFISDVKKLLLPRMNVLRSVLCMGITSHFGRRQLSQSGTLFAACQAYRLFQR